MIEHAKELLGMPPEWDAYKFEAIGRTVNHEAKRFSVKGAIAQRQEIGTTFLISRIDR